MNLAAVTHQLEDILEVRGSLDFEIKGLSYDSRQINAGFLFVTIRGLVTDGHNYIHKAIEAGAQAVVFDRPGITCPDHVTARAVR